MNLSSVIPQICREIIRVGTALVFLVPLVSSAQLYFPFVSTKALLFFALVQIIFAAWIVLLIYRPEFRPRLNFILISLSAFVAVFSLSAYFGVDPLASFWSKYDRMGGVLEWLHLLAFFLTLSSFFVTRRQWITLFSVSVAAASVVSILGLIALGDHQAIPGLLMDRTGSTIGNSSYFGAYLLFNIFFAVYLFFAFRKKEWKIFPAVAFLLMFPTLILINARAATISLIGGLVLAALLYTLLANSSKAAKIVAGGLMGAVLLVFAVSGFLVFQEGSAMNKWFVEWGHGQARLVVWDAALEGFQERPLLGWGPENFEIIHTRHFDSCLFVRECGGEIWFDRAHNIIINTLATTGILGLLSYLLLLFSFVFVLWYGFFRKKNISALTVSVFTALLAAYFVQNMTFFDIMPITIMLMLTFAFGAYLAIWGEEGKADDGFQTLLVQNSSGDWREAIKPVVAILVIIGLIISLFYFVISPLRSSAWILQAIKTERVFNEAGESLGVRSAISHGTGEKLEAYQNALDISPLGNYEVLPRFANAFLQFSRQGNLPGGVSVENLLEEAEFLIERLEEEVERSPLNFRTRLRLTELYSQRVRLLGALETPEEEMMPYVEQAAESSRKLKELSPDHVFSLVEFSQAKIFQGEVDEAFDIMMEAIDLEPAYINTYFFAINIAENLLRDEEKVLEIAELAISNNPDWQEEFSQYFQDPEDIGDLEDLDN